MCSKSVRNILKSASANFENPNVPVTPTRETLKVPITIFKKVLVTKKNARVKYEKNTESYHVGKKSIQNCIQYRTSVQIAIIALQLLIFSILLLRAFMR